MSTLDQHQRSEVRAGALGCHLINDVTIVPDLDEPARLRL